MPRTDVRWHGGRRTAWNRRAVLGAFCAAGVAAVGGREALAATGNTPLRFGLTPVFLDSDTELLAALERYLSRRLARSVALVKRRTYQEITTLLLMGQLDAAWICSFPYVQCQGRNLHEGMPESRGARPPSARQGSRRVTR
jgi:phosphonate transport system substrate-binding protein